MGKGNKKFEDILFKRSNFFPGLRATPKFWNEMEEYHFNKERLYNTIFNGFGVVPDFLDSLLVESKQTKGGLISLVVNPGLAIDGYGRPVFLYAPQVLVLDLKKFSLPCTAYVTIRYNEVLEDFYKNVDNFDLQGFQHKKESSIIEIVSEIPDPDSFIELARIRLAEDKKGSGIRELKNSDSSKFVVPSANEIDFRYVQWTSKMKKGISSFFQNFMLDIFEKTEKVATMCYTVLPLASLLSLQTLAMTSKMVIQTAGAFFDDVVSIFYPIYNVDYQLIFEIAEYERKNPEKELGYITKDSYLDAREAVFMLGDTVKTYNGTYEELNNILSLHKIVIDGLRATLSERQISTNDILLMSQDMPNVLLFNNEHYTLIDTISMGSKESMQMHDVRFVGSAYPTTSNETFTYPDGRKVNDVVKRWIGGEMRFVVRNVTKGNNMLVIRRTDVYNGNYEVDVKLNSKKYELINIEGIDTKNRWRNYHFIIDRADVVDFAPEISFDIGQKGRDNSGTIWIYQVM